jgi:hypothetical protein
MAVLADTRDRFAAAVERGQHRGTTPMLDRVDIYGTLELSWDEMPQFLGELDLLMAAATNDGEREVLQAVRRLGESCGEDRHLALRLVGD